MAVKSTLSQLLALLLLASTAALPQGDVVSQDVAVDAESYNGRSGDQWWKNYELVEDHVDDLDDQLEMLYMYSVNPLDFAAVAATTTSPRPSRPRPTTASSEFTRQTFVPNSYANSAGRGRSVFLVSSTAASPSAPRFAPTTYVPSASQPQQVFAATTGSPSYAHQQSVSSQVSSFVTDVTSPRNRVRVLVKRPTVGQKPDIPTKELAEPKPFYSSNVPKKVTSITYPESDLTQATYQSSETVIPYATEGFQPTRAPPANAAANITGETYRSTESTNHPYVNPSGASGRHPPQYTKMLNRYSLLDKVNRDLSSASSEHRDDLTLSLEESQREHSLRQTRNDVHPPSARTFQSIVLHDDPLSTAMAISTQRSRRRRPKTTTESVSSSRDDSTAFYQDATDSTTVRPNENIFSRHSTKLFRTASISTPRTTTSTGETLPVETVPSTVKRIPDSRPHSLSPRLRPVNFVASAITTEASSTPDSFSTLPPPLLPLRQDNRIIGRTGRLFTTTTPPSIIAEKFTAPGADDVPITESLRIKQTTVKPRLNDSVEGSNEVHTPTAKPARNFRARPALHTTPRPKVSAAVPDTDVELNQTLSKVKPPRGTSAFRKPFFTATTVATATDLPNNGSTLLAHVTHRPFGSSRLRLKLTTTVTASSSTSTTTEAGVATFDEGIEDTTTARETGKRRLKVRPSVLRPHKPAKLPTLTTTTRPATNSTTASIVPDTPAEPAKNAVTKKVRPRPSVFRVHGESTTHALPEDEQSKLSTAQFEEETTSESSQSFARPTSRLPIIRTRPSTRFDTGTTTLSSTSSPQKALVTEENATTSVRVSKSPVAIPKRRRRPIGSKKIVSNVTDDVLPDTTAQHQPINVATTRASRISTAPTPGVLTTSSQVRPRRRKITQRSTLSGSDEHRNTNATTVAKIDSNTLPMTTSEPHTTKTLTASTEKQTLGITKKPLLNEKLKGNDTELKTSRGSARFKPEPDDVLLLQADESGDNIWFSDSARNVEAADTNFRGSFAGAGSPGVVNIEQDPGRLWLTSSDDVLPTEVDGSSSHDNVESDQNHDTVPPLLARTGADIDIAEDGDSKPGEEVTPQLVQKSRTATFSVSSSSSVDDAKNASSSDVEETAGEKGEHPKFIIIDKTALRGSDNDDKEPEVSVTEDGESQSTTKATDSDEGGEIDQPKAEGRSKSADGGPSTSNRTSSRASTTRSRKTKPTTRASSRRQQQTTSTTSVPPTTEASTSTEQETPKPSSDSAVSYFGEEEDAPSDRGVLDDLDSGGGEDGGAESSYDPDSRQGDAEGGGEVSAIEHTDDEQVSTYHKVNSSDDGESSGRWTGLSSLSEFSGPIRVSSSINVEVLSKAPKEVQQTTRRETKSSRSSNFDGKMPLLKMTLQKSSNQNQTVVETSQLNVSDSSEVDEETSLSTTTTKRDVNNFAYSMPLIKTADDIAELFDAITNSPSEDKLIQSFQPPSKSTILKINSTGGHENATTEKETNAGDNLSASSGPTNCSKAERNLCPKDDDYPREIVDFVVRRHKDELDRLWQEIQADRTNIRLFSDDADRKQEELSVCDSSIEALQPGWAQDAVTGKWAVIINTPQYPQVIRIESCQRPQRECLFISPYYKSTCVEHYSIHRLVAIQAENLSGGPVIGIFKFPCGCSCKVEMFNTHKH